MSDEIGSLEEVLKSEFDGAEVIHYSTFTVTRDVTRGSCRPESEEHLFIMQVKRWAGNTGKRD